MNPKIGRVICWAVAIAVFSIVTLIGWQFTETAVVPMGAYIVLSWVPPLVGLGAGFLAMLLTFLFLTRKEE
jgi:hypothetical protein